MNLLPFAGGVFSSVLLLKGDYGVPGEPDEPCLAFMSNFVMWSLLLFGNIVSVPAIHDLL